MEVQEIKLMRKEPKHSHLPPEVLSERTTKLGSAWDGRGPLKGLSEEEERKYLSRLIGVSSDSPEFTKAAMSFWRSFSVNVDTAGVTLNLSRDANGDPINEEDYITYKFAKAHPHVAEDKSEAEGNRKKRFYFYNPAKETMKQNKFNKFKRKAFVEFGKMEEDENMLDIMIRLLTDTKPEQMTKPQKENLLVDFIENNPKDFYLATQDKKTQIKSEIHDMVNYGVIEKVSGQYLFMDEVVGRDMKEAIIFMEDDTNTNVITRMKAQLEEAKR